LHLNIAVKLIRTNIFQAALNKANQIWEETEDSRESEKKKYCGNIMAEIREIEGISEEAQSFRAETFDAIIMM
jgi:hypothetical protein